MKYEHHIYTLAVYYAMIYTLKFDQSPKNQHFALWRDITPQHLHSQVTPLHAMIFMFATYMPLTLIAKLECATKFCFNP